MADIFTDEKGKLKMNLKNLTLSNLGITKTAREKRNGHKSMAIWLTGLSAAGKSTIAKKLHNLLFQKGRQVFVLDGDNVRMGLNSDLGFSPEDRMENIRRIGEVAKLFTDAGFIVIVAFISPFQNDRDRVRALFLKGEFMEVYVKADVETCESRDPKGLYQKAREGLIKEFTGISSAYEPPESPELVLDTQNLSADECVQITLAYLNDQNVFFKRAKAGKVRIVNLQ